MNFWEFENRIEFNNTPDKIPRLQAELFSGLRIIVEPIPHLDFGLTSKNNSQFPIKFRAQRR